MTDEQALIRIASDIVTASLAYEDKDSAVAFVVEKLEAQKQRWQIEARVDELYEANVDRSDPETFKRRISELKSLLPSSDNQEKGAYER